MQKFATRRWLTAVVAILIVFPVACGTATPRHESADRATRVLRDAWASLHESNHAALGFSGETFAGGRYGECTPCATGPAVAGAALLASGNGADLVDRDEVVSLFDTVIESYQRPDGGIDQVAGVTTSREVTTMFFTTQLGSALLMLKPQLDLPTLERWEKSLRSAVDFLDRNGNFDYYTNGNVNVGNALGAALAWKVTGEDRYQRLFRKAFDFAIDPPRSKWDGWGLRLTKETNKSDGSDGAGYLTEAGPDRKPGYDADYTQLQADQTALLFLVTHDKEVLRLLNLLTNQLLAHTDQHNWHLDIGNGTRHPESGKWRFLETPALAVLAWRGGRDDLDATAEAQGGATVDTFAKPSTYNDESRFYQLGSRAATFVAAEKGLLG
jgi:hypothetical protein